jgi:hypothetical protein
MTQCTAGACVAVNLIDGTPTTACGDVPAFCGGAGSTVSDCAPDLHEPNDEVGMATLFGDASAMSGSQTGTACPEDVDYFRIDTTFEAEVSITLSEFDPLTDLDLKLEDASGNSLGMSTTVSAVENVTRCMAAGESIYAKVFAFWTMLESDYVLQVQRTAGTCCTNDAAEPDAGFIVSPEIALGQSWSGVLCPYDTDTRMLVVNSAKNLVLSFNHTVESGSPDVSVLISNSEGGIVTSSSNPGAVAAITFYAPSAGAYFIDLISNGYGVASYSASVAEGGASLCFLTADCVIGTVCDVLSGGCVSDVCYDPGNCPIGTECDEPVAFASPGTCVAPCVSDSECRFAAGETCKDMAMGSHCGLAGNGLIGDGCEFHQDCSGAFGCFTWPGGYCTHVDCTSTSECPWNSYCRTTTVGGEDYGICVKACSPGQNDCREDEGYVCALTIDKAFELVDACVPILEEGSWL